MIVPVIAKDAMRVAVRVIILPVPERPEKGNEPESAEKQRNRDQDDQHFHGPGPYFSRSALSDTVIEDVDIARAAIKGVAKPRRATGTATAL